MKFPTPVFQAPDAPTSPAPSAPSDSGTSSSASTPSTSPSAAVTPSPTPPDNSAPSDGVDSSSGPFDFMFEPDHGDLSEVLGSSPPVKATEATPVTQPAPAQPAKPAATPAEPPKPADGTVTPAPTEAASPTSVTQPTSTLDPYDPGALARHLTENEEQVVQQVAESLFKLSDKDVEALESDTVGTIPRLLAKAFVASQRNFLMQMQNIVPMMVQRQGELTRKHTEAESEFYSRWPDLKKDQHGETVLQYARVFRQMHPQASRKDMIEAVGPMVMMAAKITPSAAGVQPTGPVASPMTNGGGRPPQPAPFVPAGPSAGGAFPTQAPQLSEIETMFADHDQ